MAELDLRSLLNPDQYEAATTTEGPLLILAGAGSGKTRVLVHRIAHLIATGRAQPWQIFAVTFTNKAAGEMRDRLRVLLGPSVREAWIGTFHALSARMLRVEGHRLGYTSSFTIYDADDSRRLVKTVLQDVGHEGASKQSSVNAVAHEIDRAKNDGLGPETFRDAASPYDTPHRRAARRVYPRYQAALRRSNAMDFGDLLLCAVELLRHHPEVQDKWGSRFRYVMVDEFQDTNQVQYQFLKSLVASHRNLAVVGDDDQAIYRWRGADVGNILGFAEAFEGAKVVKLETNYRSTGNILAAANAVIHHNQRRHPKALRTDADPGTPVRLALVTRSEEEAGLIARSIGDQIRSGARSASDFAILYRQNAQSRLFEEAFMRERVPFVLVGGTGFYDRMEVKDILAYLRVTANPASQGDFLRIVNTPTRGLGQKTIDKLRQAGEAAGVDGAEMLNLSDAALKEAGLGPSPVKKLKALGRMLADLRDLAENALATEVAQQVVEQTGYIQYLQRSDPTTAEDRIANVGELVSSIAEFEEALSDESGDDPAEGLGLAGARTPLQAFLDGAALVSPTDQDASAESVTLMTLHSAKGLEFPVVFMVGMEEKTFPSQRAIDDLNPEALEEERRLCYVGMTRAQQELCLTAARFRRIHGREEVRLASRFLGELPDGLVETLPGTGPVTWGSTAMEPAPVRDGIEYDWAPIEEPQPYTAPVRTVQGGTGDLPPGATVWHNTFGTGTVVENDGGGANARLTIDFPVGRKRVVARFVKPQ